MMELVSVVVISYNSEKTIIETLESVKSQTYPKIELIVSDDCSKDNTVKIVKEWIEINKERFFNVKLLESQANQGAVKNCNRGIYAAQGKYVQTVAGDDRLVKEAVEEKYQFVKEHKLPLVLCKVKLFGKNNVKVHVMRQNLEKAYHVFALNKEERLHKNLLNNYIWGTMCNFFEREFFEKIKGYDTRYFILEDWPFALKLLESDIPLFMLNKELYEYRITSTSISNATNNPLLLKDCRKLVLTNNIFELLKNGWLKDVGLLFIKYFGIK